MSLEALISKLQKETDIISVEQIDSVTERAFELSQKYVPTDTGALKQSGGIVKYSNNGRRIVYDAPHALLAHELHQRNIKTEKNPNAKSQFLREALI